MSTYRVTHRTSYTYDGDVSASFGRAHLLPTDRPRQTCTDALVTITPPPDEQHEHTDAFGNRSTYFSVTTPHRALTVQAESTVTVAPAARPDAQPWEKVRDGLATSTQIDARGYVLPSPRLRPHPDVTAYARSSFPPGRPLTEAVLDLASRIHRDFRYVSGSTTVRSSPADLLAGGEGVCQDFAHLAVAGLRSLGLAARYVSGYLETRPPPGRPKVLGADASHAWVSVFTGGSWFDVDPTNDRVVDDSFVELARGRDYADVPPLRGVIFSDAKESVLKVAVDMIPIEGG
ncbi:MAG: transglutaminase family protein [Pseudonocardia sp.]|nr:transglutaminase family protein [Pseudonocardia sp.]